MNTTAKALVFALVTVASAASIGMGLAERSAQPRAEVVKLERVVVVGKRAAAAPTVVAQLPRVVIEGRRALPADGVQLAAAHGPVQAI
ncbi:hypothetical protein [Paucibacter sp. M5-1]|uniref:hypothetical protein n=1 Tax=Paucibacter sp. M5-1 TaxID=3015998 RepID=UPI0022B916DD|nr:hypothetical protein [Paucibacter sp. M5-1]MCZ7883778.1 hypothetical protein [Paucibacter sp. M5-1]